jgi:hypothetical protein
MGKLTIEQAKKMMEAAKKLRQIQLMISFILKVKLQIKLIQVNQKSCLLKKDTKNINLKIKIIVKTTLKNL